MLVLMNIPSEHWELKEKPWETIFLCLFLCVGKMQCFFYFSCSKGCYLGLLFVTASQTQGEGGGE